MTEYRAWDAGLARDLAGLMRELPGACLPILHALQDTFGYIHDEAIPIVADAVNLSKAEVVGVVEFYADFRREPPAQHVVKVCLAESCQAMGSAAVVEQLKATLGIEVGERSADRRVELEAVYCLGNCALSPAMTVDGRLYGRMTGERAANLVVGGTA